MTALAPLAPRLGKLIRLFGSDRDGEVLGAVRAADRTLKGVGLDWHSVADAIERKPEVVVVVVGREPDHEPETWLQVARWCRDHDNGRLSAKGRSFVLDMARRLVCGGRPSEKQANWLRAIYANLRKGLDQ